MIKQLYLTSLLLILLFSACSSGETDQSSGHYGNKSNPVETAKQEDIVLARIDNLEIRAKPILESSILAKAKENEKLVLTGEITSFMDTVDIKGTSYIEPWVKVKNAKNRIGWVFRGGLKQTDGGLVK